MLLWLAIVLAIGWTLAFAVYHVSYAAIHLALVAALIACVAYFVSPDAET